ncbi:MAG: hypothetical protein PHQ65_08440, partial [Bacteroidales bacterium]|nr:hypothetical protein [Bacteroidales bacterium]
MKKNNALLLLIPILILMSASCIKYIGTYSYSSPRKIVFPDSTIYFYVVYKKVAADKGPIDVRY